MTRRELEQAYNALAKIRVFVRAITKPAGTAPVRIDVVLDGDDQGVRATQARRILGGRVISSTWDGQKIVSRSCSYTDRKTQRVLAMLEDTLGAE